jgi:hypothetical protein
VLVMWGSAYGQDWESVRGEIARRESGSGRYRVGVNRDGSLDLGLYQIWEGNLRREVSGRRLAEAFDRIFRKHGIDTTHSKRVRAVRDNDRLNEALARELFRQRGIGQWTSMRKNAPIR